VDAQYGNVVSRLNAKPMKTQNTRLIKALALNTVVVVLFYIQAGFNKNHSFLRSIDFSITGNKTLSEIGLDVLTGCP
jgi:hypothetical protein